jgi:uncharacterized membrane protein HdeD (DUF308 family)
VKNSQQGALVLGDRQRGLTGPQKWSIALSLIGAVICVPAAAFFGFALGYYPSRMECTPETMGSGCYEGDLLYASLFFVVFFVPFFVASLLIALQHRKTSRPMANWWPLVVLCAVPLTVIVLAVVSATANPNEYF